LYILYVIVDNVQPNKDWDDYDGRIYIYKEPGITPLAEVHARLRDLYSKRFTAEKFDIISDSKVKFITMYILYSLNHLETAWTEVLITTHTETLL